MASTYSTSLKIELINPGEQAGAWGTTTNTNLGTALEEAIVGYGNPNFTSDGADLTLSLTDSPSTQVARNFVLNVTSGVTLSDTRNLVVPTIEKPYVVQNNTTGGQSIVVKTSGGTGITVPNGKSMVLYTDGTNVVETTTHLPVASGGTGAYTFTSGGLIRGNDASALSVASEADIVAAIGTTAVTNATNSTTVTTTNFVIEEDSSKIVIKTSGGTALFSIDASGDVIVLGNISAAGSP